MQAKYKAVQLEQKNVLKTFITENPNSYLSLLALTSVSGPSPDVAEVEPLYESLSDGLKKSEQGRQLKSAIDALKLTAIGAMAPDFIQNDVNGVPVRLSSFKGKYVLIDFWASWCGPCRQENPNVVRTYNKYKNKNFTILGVSLDRENGKSAWLAAIKNDGLTWTQVSDLKYWNNLAAAVYGVRSIPQNFLIDPTGKIVAKDLRGDDLDNKLAELLGKYN
jgi:peroxiredoxin